MKKKTPWYTFPYFVWMAIFIVVPMIIVLVFAFCEKGEGGNVVFTLNNFQKAITPDNLKMLGRSVWFALLSTVFCLLLGYPLAMIMSNMSQRAKNVAYMLLILPMWMNFLLRTYAWMRLTENTGLINTFLINIGLLKSPLPLSYTDTAVIVAMVYNFLPFMVMPIYNVLSKIDNRLIEASHDLGANAYQTFKRLILPLSLPGVISGVMMVFMPSITSFVIPQLIGGGKTMLIGNLIDEQFIKNDNPYFGSALAIFLMILVFISMSFLNRIDKTGEGGGII